MNLPYFKLSEPIRHRGRVYTGIQLKQMGPHIKKQNFGKNQAANYAAMISELSGLPRAAVLEMNAVDFMQLIPVVDDWVEREFTRLKPARGHC